MTSPKNPPAKSAGMRELGDDAFARRASTRQSKYLDNVREASKTPGKGYAIDLTADDKPSAVISQLYRAASDLGVKLTAINRSKDKEPYIGFKVHAPEEK